MNCPVCGREAEKSKMNEKDPCELWTCPVDECEGGVILHIPKGHTLSDFLNSLAYASQDLELMAEATVSTALQVSAELAKDAERN